MRERKRLMETRVDAFLAPPGERDTLEELLKILMLVHVDALRKPIVIFNKKATMTRFWPYLSIRSEGDSCTGQYCGSTSLPALWRRYSLCLIIGNLTRTTNNGLI